LSGKKALGGAASSAWALGATGPDDVWSYDFVSSRTEDGLPLRILNVVDEFTQVRVPRPPRTFLEMDELAVLLEAAEDQDRSPLLAVPIGPTSRTRDRVARLAAAGKPPSTIAQELGLAKSTVTHHLRRLGAANAGAYVGRRAIVEMLARSGIRVSELCDATVGAARLHNPDDARLRIPDAKTETGIRDVELSPDLVAVLNEHLRRLRAAGHPSGPDAYLFPNARGGRIARQRVGQILHEAANLADERLRAHGRPPLPNTTPHTLRRTYISLALIANSFDVKWVMSQVGHADSKMTLDVYAQLEQRVDRRHGTALDALIRDAHWATRAIGVRRVEHRQRPRPKEKARRCGPSSSGETRTRTGDTTIFSRAPSSFKFQQFAADSAIRSWFSRGRALLDFACFSRTLRPTTELVGLFAVLLACAATGTAERALARADESI
jgi:integrase